MLAINNENLHYLKIFSRRPDYIQELVHPGDLFQLFRSYLSLYPKTVPLMGLVQMAIKLNRVEWQKVVSFPFSVLEIEFSQSNGQKTAALACSILGYSLYPDLTRKVIMCTKLGVELLSFYKTPKKQKIFQVISDTSYLVALYTQIPAWLVISTVFQAMDELRYCFTNEKPGLKNLQGWALFVLAAIRLFAVGECFESDEEEFIPHAFQKKAEINPLPDLLTAAFGLDRDD